MFHILSKETILRAMSAATTGTLLVSPHILTWAFFGIAKIIAPAKIAIFGTTIGLESARLLGLLQVVLAALLVLRARASMVYASSILAFTLLVTSYFSGAASCGCAGAIAVRKYEAQAALLAVVITGCIFLWKACDTVHGRSMSNNNDIKNS